MALRMGLILKLWRADLDKLLPAVEQREGSREVLGEDLLEGRFGSIAAGEPENFWRAASLLLQLYEIAVLGENDDVACTRGDKWASTQIVMRR